MMGKAWSRSLEGVRAWKFILNPRFDAMRDHLDETIRAWFEEKPVT
jgi:hypothetical protein